MTGDSANTSPRILGHGVKLDFFELGRLRMNPMKLHLIGGDFLEQIDAFSSLLIFAWQLMPNSLFKAPRSKFNVATSGKGHTGRANIIAREASPRRKVFLADRSPRRRAAFP